MTKRTTFLFALLAMCSGALGASGALWAKAVFPLKFTEIQAILLGVLVTGVVGLFAILVAVAGVISARSIARRQTTFNHITTWLIDGTAQEAQKEYSKLAKEGNLRKYAQEEYQGSDELKSILTVINDFEIISVGIQRGVIDPEIYQLWYRSQVLRTWDATSEFIYDLRKRVGAKTLFHEFEEMAKWMNDEKIPHRRFWWFGL